MNRFGTAAIAAAIAGVFLVSGLWRPSARGQEGMGSPHGDLKEDCSTCHTSESWVPARISPEFNHAKYGLPLVGAHRETPCASCHTSLDFGREQAACMDCHQDVHDGELGVECETCHTTRSFIDRAGMERMHQMTRFPLTGVHVTLDCMTCHQGQGGGNLLFVNQSTECIDCHRDALLAAVPDHTGFDEDCTACHGTTFWDQADFDHQRTAFPLTGAHVATPCASCHGDGPFTKLNSACVSCHQVDYDGTTDPPHAEAGFDVQCESCHNTTSWEGGGFDHALTRFPLTGAHQSEPCASCHGGGVYAGLAAECEACHRDDYDGTTDPNHAAANFPVQCEECHDTTTWGNANWDHMVYFPIDSGAHAGQWNTCAECHFNPASFADFTCLTCHPHSDQVKTDGAHPPDKAPGYAYESQACYSCHPDGTH